MKTKLNNFFQDCWQTLTEVPGWPNAPRKVRLRRTLPLVVPFVLMLLILAWNKGVRDPHIQSVRQSNRGLSIEQGEIDSLGLKSSEQQAAELSAHAVQVAGLVLKEPGEIAALLQELKKDAAAGHWDGTFVATDASGAVVSPETNLIYLPVRAKLASSEKNPAAFAALLVLFEQLSTAQKRIDLTRMGIRADEQGRYTVELTLRLMSRIPNEKTPQ